MEIIDNSKSVLAEKTVLGIIVSLHKQNYVPINILANELITVASIVAEDKLELKESIMDVDDDKLDSFIIQQDLIATALKLKNEEEIELSMISEAMISISRKSHEDIELIDDNDDNDDDLDFDFDFDDDYKVNHGNQEFNNSSIHNAIKELFLKENELSRNLKANKEELYSIQLQIIQLSVEHAKAWISLNNKPKYYFLSYDNENISLLGLFERIMRVSVVLNNKNIIESSILLARQIEEIIGKNEDFDLNYLEESYTRFVNDVDIYEKIYNFIKNNPMFPQNKIYKELSISGRHYSYIFDWADKMNKIERLKSGRSWLLKIKKTMPL